MSDIMAGFYSLVKKYHIIFGCWIGVSKLDIIVTLRYRDMLLNLLEPMPHDINKCQSFETSLVFDSPTMLRLFAWNSAIPIPSSGRKNIYFMQILSFRSKVEWLSWRISRGKTIYRLLVLIFNVPMRGLLSATAFPKWCFLCSP